MSKVITTDQKTFPCEEYSINIIDNHGTEWGGVGERRWDHRIRSESNLYETYGMIMPRLRIRVPMPFMMKDDGVTRVVNKNTL